MSPLYTPGKLTLRQTWQPMDPDAAAYITAVETADGQALEEKVKIAIDNFVLGCKADGIWSAIKASCILAGARTLAGALVPLVGTAPTNYNFVAGDYDRETGLVGDGSTKYLDSNRNNNADPQDNKHLAVYCSSVTAIPPTSDQPFVCTSQGTGRSVLNAFFQASVNRSTLTTASILTAPSFAGASRATSSILSARRNNQNVIDLAAPSETPLSENLLVFRRINASTEYANARLAFYSIGEALDLAKLDARVTDLINAIGVAIP